MSKVDIKRINTVDIDADWVILANTIKDIDKSLLTKAELNFTERRNKEKDTFLIKISRLDKSIWLYFFNEHFEESYKNTEEYRRAGNDVMSGLSKNSSSKINIIDFQKDKTKTFAFLEGLLLGGYRFDKYKKEKKQHCSVLVMSKAIEINDLNELQSIVETVFKCKDLINEPYCYLTTSRFAEEIKQISNKSGINLSFLNKLKIASLKMGGILAVNKGSSEDPFLAVAEWKPQNAINKSPYIIVGKGITFDTGGYSIKTSIGMEEMKIDMSGGAIAISILSLIAINKLPIHVIALVPATDNMVSNRAQLPGDIITMHDGTTVEVLNTDAEGRLILADTLSYAKKYKPELVIDIATLTGSAHLALGKYSIFAAGKKHENAILELKKSGENVYERLVEFPLWDEYAESLNSKIADLKNVGARHAGAIIASKFLEHFTDYPWIHLDIAGPSYFEKSWNYHTSGATGIGIRLIYDFFKKMTKEE